MREVIVISALWCPSCLLLKKELKRIHEEYNLDFKMLDYDFDEDKVKEYGVGNILPVMIYQDKRLIGERSYEEIISFLKECKLI